jgi:hypothetical protein
MINLRDVSLQVSWWSACGAEHHDHWSAIVAALIPREGLIISHIVSRMITESLLVRGYGCWQGCER